jgi:hypothetical protein
MSESQIIHTPDSSGAGVRTVSVVTMINGTPTTVQMQVVSIADEAGNIVRDFANYNMQLEMLQELRAIKRLIAQRYGMFEPGIGGDPQIIANQQ